MTRPYTGFDKRATVNASTGLTGVVLGGILVIAYASYDTLRRIDRD